MSKRPYIDDEFEQFDDSSQRLDDNVQDSVRTRQVRIIKTIVPQALADADLRRKINARAIAYLSRREYSRAELKSKLISAFENYASDDMHDRLIESILDDLQRGNWQSDTRYAAQLSKVKGERFGVARLKYEFKQKGLDDELVQHELGLLKSSEFERAKAIWHKKFGAPPVDLKEKAKQVRFMASRGFTFEIVSKIIKNLDDEL